MELRLLVVGSDGVDREVLVRADPAHRVVDLADALAAHLRLDGPPGPLHIDGLPAPLPADAPLGGCGLRQGDRVVLSADARVPATPPADVVLVAAGGPAIGTRLALPAGTSTVGRGGDAGLELPDPFVSRRHLHVTVDDDRVAVADAGSSNGTTVDGDPVGTTPRAIAAGAMLTAGASLLRVDPAAPSAPRARATDGVVAFNRPPRVAATEPARSWTVPAPPEAPARTRLPWITSLVPLVMGVGLWLVADNASFLAFAALSPLLAIGSYVEDRRGGRRERVERVHAFEQAVDDTRSALRAAVHGEEARRRRATPDAADLLDRAAGPRRDLWERDLDDPDALLVRVGWGDAPSRLAVTIEAGGDARLRAEATARLAGFERLHAVPVTLALGTSGSVGIAGGAAAADDLARWLVAQLATLHPPGDLVIAAAIHPDRGPGWGFASWLPHVGPETSPLQGAGHLARDAAGGNALLQAALELVRTRARTRKEASFGIPGPAGATPVVVLVLDGALPLGRDDVAELLRGGPDEGVHVVWCDRTVNDLPADLRAVVTIQVDDGTLELVDTATGDRQPGRGVDGLGADLALQLARRLAPVRDRSARGAAGAIPRTAPLLDLLELAPLDGPTVAQRWRQRTDALDAVIGVGAAGPLTVDLRRDGPHALLGGTTGAGKSELLQSLVAAMAATHPPDRLTFLLIDYKGGAAFKDCVELPHTVGLVTDLDGALVHRALVSLHAELRRREHVLRDADAKDLPELEAADPHGAPPSLVIVVDEFATLVKELPEFVEGIVDVAQRGRSLGVHLVLATQRPSGAINDNIRANTNLRIALRMNDEADSEDVLGVADAAHIPRTLPGRGYVRTGPREYVEVQAAYVGGHSGDTGPTVPLVTVRDSRDGTAVGDTGQATELRRDLTPVPTDLDRLVAAVHDASVHAGIAPPPRPWLPPLPAVVALDEIRDLPATATPGAGVVGQLDVAEEQAQRPWRLDLESDGGLLVYGAAGSGKTTVLRTLAASLAATTDPARLHLYGLDFGARGLAPLTALPHCGDVVPGEDLERVTRLVAQLQRTVAQRRAALGGSGTTSLAEHEAATGQALPRVVLLLDEVAGLVAAFERIDHGALLDALPRLVADGRAVGVHLVATAQRRSDIPQQLAGLVPTRVVLSLLDEDDYVLLGVAPAIARGLRLPPGRGLVDGRHQLQVAVVGGDPDGAAQAAALQALGPTLPAADPPVPAVRLLPARLDRASLPAPVDGRTWIGVSEDELAPVALALADGHLLVVGRARSGRSTALATLVQGLAAGQAPPRMVLLAPRRSPLADHAGLFAAVAEGSDACDELVERLQPDAGDGRPLVIVVDDAEELVHTLADGALEALARSGRGQGVHVVAAVEVGAAHGAFSGMLAELRKDRHGLLLRPDPEADGDILGVRLERRSTLSLPAGRGYLVRDGVATLVQVAGG